MGVGKSTFAFTNSSVTLDGDSTTINIVQDDPSYSHKLSHNYGVIATLAVGVTSYVWTPTADSLSDFFAEIPNQKTRLIDVYLDTYDGSKLIGRDVHALTVTLSEATGKPAVSGFAITDDNNVANRMGIIIDGKSSLTVSKTVTTKYGASVTKTVYVYEQKEYTDIGNLIASLPLTTTPTRFSISCVVADSRGFTASANEEKLFASYKAPTIDAFEVVRCDADGNETEIGTNAKAIVNGSWCDFSGKNVATFKIGYKISTATEYTYQTIDVSGGIVNIEQILSDTFDELVDYVFSVSLADAFTTYVESEKDFANVKNIIYVSADGNELSFDADIINIGKKNATINLVGKKAQVKYESGSEGSHTLTITDDANSAIYFEHDEAGNKYINILSGNSGVTISADGGVYANKEFEYEFQDYGNTVDLDTLCPSSHTAYTIMVEGGAPNLPSEHSDIGGWLEVFGRSKDWCYQRFTSHLGRSYERNKIYGAWESWRKIMRQYLLFDNVNNSFTSGAHLSEDVGQFDKITICYRSNDNYYGSVDVWNPNGKYAVLTSTTFTGGSSIILKTKTVYIYGHDITTSNIGSSSPFYVTGEVALISTTPTSHADFIGITQVIGWK